MPEPNVDFGSPSILFDSHPEEQDSYLGSYWTSLKSQLHTAFWGDVPKFHPPGKLRIVWYTHDGSQGLKDYDLHQYVHVRDNFDVLLDRPEIHRVIIMGYSGQNPYVRGNERIFGGLKGKQRVDANYETHEEQTVRRKLYDEMMDKNREGRVGKAVHIEEVIWESDRIEDEEIEKKRIKEIEKFQEGYEEKEGLLIGDMV
jgi:hypothetical protein